MFPEAGPVTLNSDSLSSRIVTCYICVKELRDVPMPGRTVYSKGVFVTKGDVSNWKSKAGDGRKHLHQLLPSHILVVCILELKLNCLI